MKQAKTDYSHITTGIELQNFLREEFQEKYSQLYFHADYINKPYRRLSIVFYNADKSADEYTISQSGNIAIHITGFTDKDEITNLMSANCIRSREIDILMAFATQNGNISKIINYILKKFKSLNLEKVTSSTRHLEKIKEYKEAEKIPEVVEEKIEVFKVDPIIEEPIEEVIKPIIEIKFCNICQKEANHIDDICQRHLILKKDKPNINIIKEEPKKIETIRAKRVF